MKYSDANKPLVCMMTKSTCYTQTRTMDVKGVLWHSTGANNPNLKRYVQPSENDPNYQQLMTLLGKNQYGNDWNHVSLQAGLNCWIGKLANGEVTTIQTMPWNYRPWGCGSGSKGSCNSGWIQFEICEDSLTDANYFNKVYQEACEITAYLCKMFNINPHGTVNVNGVTVPTILCHYDSYKLGLGNNHGDIYHWFPKFGKNMETVRDDVAALLGTSSTVVSQPTIEQPVSIAVRYQGTVTATSGLNCRTTNSTAGAIIKTYPLGTVLTISKESNGWGYTGEGWVSLNYINKLSAEITPPQTAAVAPITSNPYYPAIDRLIATAKAEEGYLEKASNSQLDDKTANAGDKNWTKYARDLDNMGDIYNGKKNGYAWCDMFVDWCFIKTFGKDIGMKLLCQSYKGGGAGCTESAAYYKNKGQFFKTNPHAGDQIFFTNDGGKTSCHTGIVIAVDNSKVYTIEGNTSSAAGVVANGGCVRAKSYSLTYANIYGYGRPNWSIVPNIEEDEDMTQDKFNEMMNNYLADLATKDTTWAQDYLTWAKQTGIMKGDKKGRMMPLKLCTRQETVAMLKRLYDLISREKK